MVTVIMVAVITGRDLMAVDLTVVIDMQRDKGVARAPMVDTVVIIIHPILLPQARPPLHRLVKAAHRTLTAIMLPNTLSTTVVKTPMRHTVVTQRK
ncbi:hypothetical protein PC116_g32490 [Phytophthora cactorum]|nr:hypothetical protein PC116_g32490 [Phytophthora cactorum]